MITMTQTTQPKLTLTKFFETDYVDYSSYSNLRMIGSVVDGQKNSSRKILHTVLEHNIKTPQKVTSISSRCAEFTEYLHGTLDGVIVTLAQNFPGANNVPLLVREGNFGTRFDNEASAARYIFTHGSDEFFQLFNKDDSPVLKHQTFEGTKIEPVFFVPTLPVLLLNGSSGVSTGFAQQILPRNPKDVQKYLEAKLTKGRTPKLIPWYNGFNGTVTQGQNSKQWEIRGVVERLSVNRFKITEIPVGIGLIDYIKVLDKLEDDKIIQSYKDLSEDNKFLFEVKMASKDLASLDDDQLLTTMKLIKRVSENFTCMSEDNKIIVFESTEELIEHYIKVKMEYLDLRKEYKLNELKDDISIEESRYAFINAIVQNELIINKRKKSEIENDLVNIPGIIKQSNSYDYLLNMSIHSLTSERLDRLSKIIKDKNKELQTLDKMSISDIWINEIKSLKF